MSPSLAAGNVSSLLGGFHIALDEFPLVKCSFYASDCHPGFPVNGDLAGLVSGG